ncbi:MAG: TVP38/TMEM64 family protein [Planctomycetota bacterium]
MADPIEDVPPPPPTSSKRWLITLLLLVAVSIGFMFLPVADWVKQLQSHVDALGWIGPIAFIAIYALFTICLFPGTPLTIAAGALFGLGRGLLFAVIGSNLGAFAAFLLARTILRKRAEALAREHPRFAAIDSALGQNGFKIVTLLRLSPVFPFCALNYLLGLTRVHPLHYALAGIIGMLPGTAMLVYIGSLSTSLASGGVGESPDIARMKLTMRIVGFVATVLVTGWVTRLASKALKEQGAAQS